MFNIYRVTKPYEKCSTYDLLRQAEEVECGLSSGELRQAIFERYKESLRKPVESSMIDETVMTSCLQKLDKLLYGMNDKDFHEMIIDLDNESILIEKENAERKQKQL